MKKILIIISLLSVAEFSLSSQEIQRGSIIALGEEHPIDFIEKDGKTYISWLDLNASLPNWFIINKEGKIVLTDELIVLLYSGIVQTQQSNENVIESRIDGDFEGWDGETIFKLTNGQIWQQDEYDYTYTYKYRPEVTIIKTSSGWKMQVEGVSDTIRVKKLK